MQNFFLFLIAAGIGAFDYLFYVGIFIPQVRKNALYAKLKAKERAELDVKLGAEQYFGMRVGDDKK